MPKMVTVIPNKHFVFQGDAAQKAAQKKIFDALKPHKVSYIQARENLRAMKGMLLIEEDDPKPSDPGFTPLQDRSIAELKVMMASMGVKTEKQMTKSEIVALITKKLDDIEVTDD